MLQKRFRSVIIIGNTKQLWHKFITNYQADSLLQSSSQPLDSYTTYAIEASIPLHANTLSPPTTSPDQSWRRRLSGTFSIGYGHLPDKHGNYYPLQRLAHESGLAYFHAKSHLNLHPVYGPWIALRAVMVVDLDINTRTFTRNYHTTVPSIELPLISHDQEDSIPDYPESIHESPLQTRLRIGLGQEGWKHWQYGAHQMSYHYTKNRDFLHLECD